MRVIYLAALTTALTVAALSAQTAKKTPPPAAPSKAAMAVSMPPIPSLPFSPGRPVDQTRAVYKFAAEHPEVLKFVPCYCGCESTGHPHNESCFVKRRDAKGNVVEWDTHGYG
jgi:hypothetical protein